MEMELSSDEVLQVLVTEVKRSLLLPAFEVESLLVTFWWRAVCNRSQVR